MSKSQPTPSSPPPPYQDATSSSAPTTQHPTTSSHLEVPSKSRNGIPISARRSMEDEARSLPTGWVRQYDSKSHHQFFVDTTASPPRSIWHHPYDDEQYLATLSAAERAEIMNHRHHMEDEDVSSADEHELPPREQGGELTGGKKLGRRIKDKLTHSTHEQRVAERQRRDEEDAKAYRQHQHIRQQMALAAETGVPQLLGKDKDGNDVYIEPPGGPGGYGGGGFNGAGYNDGGYGGGGGQRSYNPYTQGPYSDPNAKFVRPPNPYNRAYPGYGYGYGYGGYGGYGGLGGFGAAPLLGLGGGLLLGGLLF